MRVDRLELKAFGPFTDKVLDFTQRPRALQLIYGPNEAGKSSTLRALISLFYGIDQRTTDNHLHDFVRLRIGATLSDEQGNSLRVIRRKGLKNTLLDEHEQPLGEGALTPLLGGLDEALFRQMFGLDHVRLREGAEALLRGGGQLGEVLFDASTGGRGVQTLIESLRAEAESLYKTRGRTPLLNLALEGVREKKAQRKHALLEPQAYADQQTHLAEARLERDRAVEERRVLGTEKARLVRSLQLVPLLAKRDLASAELHRFSALAAQVEQATQAGADDAQAASLLEETVQELNRRFGSVLANDREQPARLAELAALERDADELRARLGQGLASLSSLQRLDSATRARLRKLVEDERKLSGEQAELARVDAGALEQEGLLRARLSSMPVLEPGPLPSLLLEVEREELSAQLLRLELELDKLRAQLTRRAGQLGLTLSLEQLATSVLPPTDAVSELELLFEQREREAVRLQQERAQGVEQSARWSAQRAELLARGELASLSMLEQARAERDAAFDALFSDVSAPSSVSAAAVRAFAASSQRADALADRRVREAQEAAELARIDLALDQLRQQQEQRELALEKLALAGQEQHARWQQLVAPFGLAQHAPRTARPLLLELSVLREQLRERFLLEQQRVELEQRASARISELRALLPHEAEGAAEPAKVREQLERQCQRARELRATLLERQRERDALQSQLDKLGSERALRTGRATVIAHELSLSHQRYLEQLGRLGLSPSESMAPLAPDELLACFDELTLLAQRTRELSALKDRLEAARVARVALTSEVLALAAQWLPPVPEGEASLPLEQALAALSRVQRARSDALRDQLRVRAELEKLDEQLLSLSDGVPEAELRLSLSGFDPHAARARLEEIELALEEQSEKSADAEQRIGRLSAGLERLEQVSGAGALAEDYELELAQARALARRYVEVRLALSLLGNQVERYRSTHQQPVLKRASELFPRLTLQHYRGLTVEFDEQDQPVLSCLVAGGRSVAIGALSDGTRDQLYLALRIASIERYFEGRPPLPLILDDALIHFDDTRAAAALEVLGELTRHTQVLFFTHHKRMVELSQAALGEHGVQLHELSGRLAPRSDGPLFDSTLS